jgi:hypothetical protein
MKTEPGAKPRFCIDLSFYSNAGVKTFLFPLARKWACALRRKPESFNEIERSEGDVGSKLNCAGAGGYA